MWPEIALYDEVKAKKEKHELRKAINKKWKIIEDHFEGSPESLWVNNNIKGIYLVKFGTDIITKQYGFCEYCYKYIGPNALIRQRKRIPVINGYCKQLNRGVAPTNRCIFWEPFKLYQQMIVNTIMDQTYYDPDMCPWLQKLYDNDEDY